MRKAFFLGLSVQMYGTPTTREAAAFVDGISPAMRATTTVVDELQVLEGASGGCRGRVSSPIVQHAQEARNDSIRCQ